MDLDHFTSLFVAWLTLSIVMSHLDRDGNGSSNSSTTESVAEALHAGSTGVEGRRSRGGGRGRAAGSGGGRSRGGRARDDGAGAGGSSSALSGGGSSGGSSSGIGSRGSGGSTGGLGGGASGRGGRGGHVLVGIDTLLNGVGDTGRQGASDARQRGRDLGGDGIGQVLGSSVLLLQLSVDSGTSPSGHEVGFLRNQIINGGLHLLGEILNGASDGESISGAELRSSVDSGDTRVNLGDQGGRGGLDFGGVASRVRVDGRVKRLNLGVNVGKDARDGSSVTLDEGRLASNLGGVGHDTGGQQSEQGSGELHLDGDNDGS